MCVHKVLYWEFSNIFQLALLLVDTGKQKRTSHEKTLLHFFSHLELKLLNIYPNDFCGEKLIAILCQIRTHLSRNSYCFLDIKKGNELSGIVTLCIHIPMIFEHRRMLSKTHIETSFSLYAAALYKRTRWFKYHRD
jgi:hypothetical protein